MRLVIYLFLSLTALLAYDTSKLFKQTPVLDSLQQLYTLQSQAFDHNTLNNDEQMQKILKEDRNYLQDILITVKEDPYCENFIHQEAFDKRISFLKRRMALNRKLGNDFAIKRDQIALGYLEQMQLLDNYIISLAQMVQAYASQKEIQDYARSIRQEHHALNKELFHTIYESVLRDSNPIAQEIQQNYKDYITASETYGRLLDFTLENPELLTQKNLFTLIDYDDIINSVNANTAARQFNRHISFLYLNSGKLVTILLISLLLWITLYLSKRLLRIPILNFRHYEGKKLLRPIRLLLWVSALNYVLLTLMYPLQPGGFSESLILLAQILALAYLSMEFIAYLVIGYSETTESSRNEKTLISLFIDLLKSLIIISSFVYFLNKMGVSLQTVLTSLGIFGIGIALAAKDSIANLFGSLNLLLDNTFSQGDYVKIGQLEGEIVKVGLRSTQIRAFDNSLIIIPNSEVNLKPIVNWSKRRLGREIKTRIAVAYSTQPHKLEEIIEEIRYLISQHPDLVQNEDIEKYEKDTKGELFVSKRNLLGLKKDRFVYLDSFDDSHLSILVQTFSRTLDREEWFKVKENLLFAIWRILQKHEVEFALPSQNLFIRNKDSKQV